MCVHVCARPRMCMSLCRQQKPSWGRFGDIKRCNTEYTPRYIYVCIYDGCERICMCVRVYVYVCTCACKVSMRVYVCVYVVCVHMCTHVSRTISSSDMISALCSRDPGFNPSIHQNECSA